jgi:hypothetical protein
VQRVARPSSTWQALSHPLRHFSHQVVAGTGALISSMRAFRIPVKRLGDGSSVNFGCIVFTPGGSTVIAYKNERHCLRRLCPILCPQNQNTSNYGRGHTPGTLYTIFSNVGYFEFNSHPRATGVVGKRFHADHNDVRLRAVYKPRGKVPVNVSHRRPWDSMVVAPII